MFDFNRINGAQLVGILAGIAELGPKGWRFTTGQKDGRHLVEVRHHHHKTEEFVGDDVIAVFANAITYARLATSEPKSLGHALGAAAVTG